MPAKLLSTAEIKSAIRQAVETNKPTALSAGEPPGLVLTVSKTGTATWTLRYKVAGRARELSMARFPDLSLTDARAQAREHRVAIAQGRDPAGEKIKARAEKAGTSTVRKLVEAYLEKVDTKHAANTRRQRDGIVNRFILPNLGSTAVTEVDADRIIDLIEKVARDATPRMAVATLSTLRCLFDFGINKRLVRGANPTAGIKGNVIVDLPERRTRLMLTEDELRRLLTADIPSPHDIALRIMLGTAVRISELMEARWDDVDLEHGLWRIPISKTSKDAFLVPLSPWLIKQFEVAKALSKPGNPAVFPSPKPRVPNMSQVSVRSALRAVSKGAGVRPHSPHDLRSTARSWFSTLGAPVHVAERALNHSLGGLLAIYDQNDLMPERRVLMDRWSDVLQALEEGRDWNADGSVVVPFKKLAVV
jgi:integrase